MVKIVFSQITLSRQRGGLLNPLLRWAKQRKKREKGGAEAISQTGAFRMAGRPYRFLSAKSAVRVIVQNHTVLSGLPMRAER